MFCPKCGKQLPENASFCSGCGAKLAQKAAPAVSASPTPAAASGAAALKIPFDFKAPQAFKAPEAFKVPTSIDVAVGLWYRIRGKFEAWFRICAPTFYIFDRNIALFRIRSSVCSKLVGSTSICCLSSFVFLDFAELFEKI